MREALKKNRLHGEFSIIFYADLFAYFLKRNLERIWVWILKKIVKEDERDKLHFFKDFS